MTDYSQINDYSVKDGLVTGDPLKLIKGSDIDGELAAISTAITSKYDNTDIATVGEAEAGVSNTKLITPARLTTWAQNGSGALDDIQDLTDPDDDRILFWDDSAGAVTWLDLGVGLETSGTTLQVASDVTDVALPSQGGNAGNYLTTNGTTASWDKVDGSDLYFTNLAPSANTVERTVGSKLDEFISVNDFGAVGDGVTDSTTAIQNALNEVVLNGGTLWFPDRGIYRVTEMLTIDDTANVQEARSIELRGHASNASDNPTEILLEDTDGTHTALLQILSGCTIRIQGLRFSVQTDTAANVINIIRQAAGGVAASYLSSITVSYQDCHFVPRGSTYALDANVYVYDSVLTTFHNCWFTGTTGTGQNTNAAIILGANASGSGTFGNGNCAGASFHNCLFAVDVKHRRGWNFTYYTCMFQQRSDGTATVVGASGDQQDRQVGFYNCSFNGGDGTRTAITQGTSGESLTVVGCRINSVAKGILINGEGHAHIAGNKFLGSSMVTAIDIGSTARNVYVCPSNDFEDIITNSNTTVDDNSTLTSRHYWQVNKTATVNFSISGTNSWTGNYIGSTTADTMRGYYQVNVAAEIESFETTEYELRITHDSIVKGNPVRVTIPSGQIGTLTLSQAIYMPDQNNAVVRAEVKQLSNTVAGNVKADSSFFQMYRLPAQG